MTEKKTWIEQLPSLAWGCIDHIATSELQPAWFLITD